MTNTKTFWFGSNLRNEPIGKKWRGRGKGRTDGKGEIEGGNQIIRR